MAGKLDAASLVLAAVLGGCGDATPDAKAADAGPVTLVIGGGDGSDVFTPLVEGGTIFVYAGPQGGFHVFLSVRVTGLDPGELERPSISCASQQPSDEPCVDLVVRDPGVADPLDFFVPLHLGLAAVADGPPGRYELAPSRLVQLDIGGLADVDGKLLDVRATVTDRHGQSGSTGVTVRAVGVPLL